MIYFLRLLFLIIHESGLGDNENWEDTNTLVKNFLPEIIHEYVVVNYFLFELIFVFLLFFFVLGYGNVH